MEQTCRKCNTDNPDTAKYCNSCGNNLDERSSVERLKLEISERRSESIIYILAFVISILVGAPMFGFGLASGDNFSTIAGTVLLLSATGCMIASAYHETKRAISLKELKEIL